MLDAMRMRTACFARAPQRYTSRLSKHFLLTFQEVTPPSKTRNQLYLTIMGGTLELSRTLKVRGGIISQANRYLGGFCSSQRIFPPQIIQVLLTASCMVGGKPFIRIQRARASK